MHTTVILPKASQGRQHPPCLRLQALGLSVWWESLGQTPVSEGHPGLWHLRGCPPIFLILLLFPSHSMKPPVFLFYLVQQKWLVCHATYVSHQEGQRSCRFSSDLKQARCLGHSRTHREDWSASVWSPPCSGARGKTSAWPRPPLGALSPHRAVSASQLRPEQRLMSVAS